jgi:hypothetical protein
MSSNSNERNRMIVDLPSEVQMAIRLRAVKSNTTTGNVVCEAVQRAFASDVAEAKAALAEQQQSAKPGTKRQQT